VGFINRLIYSIVIGSLAWFLVLTLNNIGVPLFSGILTELGLLMTISLALIEVYTVYLPD